MTEHLTDIQIERYQKRTISPAELVGLDRHAAACAECRRKLGATGQEEEKFLSLKRVLDSEPDDEHLDYEHLVAYVDGLLGDEEAGITESHLAACHECQLMASDLRVFKDEVAPDLNKVYAPPQPQHVPSYWQRLMASVNSALTFKSPALAMSFGMIALFIIGVAAWLVWRSNEPGSVPPQVAQNPGPTPVATPTQEGSPQNDINANPTPTPEATPEEVLLALNDGPRRVAIDEQGNLTGLDELSPAHRQAVKNALATQQVVNTSTLAGLNGKRGELRGASDGSNFAPLNPLGKIILTTRPTLSWSKLDGATSYRVVVYDSNFNPISSSPQLKTHSWAVPQDLKRGEIYSWQVIATKDAQEVKTPVPPAPEAKFKVLEQAKANQLNRARQSYGSSHLTLGVLYAQAGLLDEAEREFSLLLKANPDSNVARNLLRNVRAMRRTR